MVNMVMKEWVVRWWSGGEEKKGGGLTANVSSFEPFDAINQG